MASGTSVLRVILEMVTGKYVAGAKTAATETGRLSDTVKKAGAAAGGLQKAFVGVAGVLGSAKVLKDLAQMAADDAKQQDILAQTLRNTTGATKEQVAANEEWISSFSRSVGIADDKLRPAFGLLAIAGRSVEQTQKDMAVAADIATARNLDLATVSTAMAKAAQGQTTALRRLGIQTSDASGEALTYDEILKNAAETMGGTATKAALSLGGQLERQKIQWEETKEAIGGAILPSLTRLGDAFQLVVADITDTEEAATQVTVTLNEMVRQGIDPTANTMASFVAVLGEAAAQATASAGPFSALGEVGGDLAGTIDQLTMSLSLTPDQLMEARSAILENGEAWGYDARQIEVMVTALEGAIRKQGAANVATKEGTRTQAEYAAAVRESRTALAEGADIALRYFNSNQRLVESQQAYTAAVAEFGPASSEALDAFGNLINAQGEVDAAQKTLAEEGTADVLRALEEMGIRAGLTTDEINILIGALRGVVGVASTFRDLPPLTIRTQLATSSTGGGSGDRVRAHGGPVTAGTPYTVGERGPETFVPYTSGRIIPTTTGTSSRGDVSISIVSPTTQTLDRDLAYGAILAGLVTQVGA